MDPAAVPLHMNDEQPSTPRFGAWEFLALIAILGLPGLLWLDARFWELPLELLPQAFLMPLLFAEAALAAAAVGGGAFRRMVAGTVVLAAGGGLAYVLPLVRPEVPISRGALGLACGIGWALLAGGVLLGGWPRRVGLAALAVLAAWLLAPAAGALLDAWTSTPGPETEVALTSYYPLSITRFDDVIPVADRRRGGGIAPLDDDFLGLTGAGALYRVRWDSAASAPVARRVAIPPPFDFAAFDAAVPATINRDWFRTQDVATRRVDDGWELYVSHHHWDGDGRCITLRVSRARLDDALGRVAEPWSPLFEAHPCLPVGGDVRGAAFVGLESGGRLAWASPDRLLLTVGDHQFDGWNREVAAAQAEDYDYGKTFLIDVETGEARRFTTGHRNPQGLFIDPAGRVWSTEHGPQGGDELNLLTEGADYGWPWATYGTDYQRFVWPPAETGRARDDFVEPVYAWVPSIAVSNLIEVEGDRFPRWRGDLLVGSLQDRTLFRLHVVEGRVVVAEPTPIGRPIRDLIEGPDGRIWLWGDFGEVTVIDRAGARSRGEIAFAACAACHVTTATSGGLGPTLRGIVGRRVASRRDFDYSPALRALGGRWTRERLDAFITDPGVFAPGTAMTFRLPDPEDRAAVLDYLESLP